MVWIFEKNNEKENQLLDAGESEKLAEKLIFLHPKVKWKFCDFWLNFRNFLNRDWHLKTKKSRRTICLQNKFFNLIYLRFDLPEINLSNFEGIFFNEVFTLVQD